MTRDDVLAAYTGAGWDYIDLDAMADEIVRLRKQLEIATSMLGSKSRLFNGLQDENDRLRDALKHETQWTDAGIDSTEFWQKQRDDLAAKLAAVEAECDDLREMVNATQMAETVASAELEHLRRVLAALREPSEAIMKAAVLHYSGDMQDAIRAAVAAAEQEVQGAS